MESTGQGNRNRLTEPVWSEGQWAALELMTGRDALRAPSPDEAWKVIQRAARRVMSTFSTSFFLVSRLLPRPKREMVEIIYAAVRYPDEIVDSLPLSQVDQERKLGAWEKAYETALVRGTLLDSLQSGVSPILAGFVAVCHRLGIPGEYYRSFLAAMRRDIHFRPFADLHDLIDSYVYGSAIVVGYFLTHVYGAASEQRFDEALECSRDLGIALQLTNFLRDVGEDRRRGRVYLPLELLRQEGLSPADLLEERNHQGAIRVIGRMAAFADEFYQRAEDRLEVFSPDCRMAIDACIRIYRRLNRRIAEDPNSLHRRHSLPMGEKIRALPPKVYWRLLSGWIR